MPTKKSPPSLTHLDSTGAARMVDVSAKGVTTRVAVATARVTTQRWVIEQIEKALVKKGDVLGVARIAAIQAAKRTSELIPLCHPLPIEEIGVELLPNRDDGTIAIEVRVKTTAKTGVEMEALTAAAVAALTVYDMIKGLDKGVVIGPIQLEEKRGGKSGAYRRKAKEGRRAKAE